MRHNRKITQELISSICDRILQGERIRAVAKAEAIGRSTFFIGFRVVSRRDRVSIISFLSNTTERKRRMKRVQLKR